MLAGIGTLVNELSCLNEEQRRKRLREIIGPPSVQIMELDWRAQLMTALREAGMYPTEPKP